MLEVDTNTSLDSQGPNFESLKSFLKLKHFYELRVLLGTRTTTSYEERSCLEVRRIALARIF